MGTRHWEGGMRACDRSQGRLGEGQWVDKRRYIRINICTTLNNKKEER